ncbi:Cytochrome c556 [Pseudomonas flavescens]|uniref:Cytochrome c556 n=1 Tax=Phytopseudomonas flavescens TaxID=29435 RepID=A0A1G8DZ38_9GAMM|nr:cytochrome c [Pseudomonas flavescens]SDH62821.1 Cytochrome c556 [Pseudomonas flavescens]
MRAQSFLLLFVLLLGACGGVDPDSPQGRRQVLFKQMLANSEELGGMLRGRLTFDLGRFAQGARQLDALSGQPWQYFPEPDESERSTARAEIWQQHERFQVLAAELQDATSRLAALAGRPQVSGAELQAALSPVEGACKRCHESFRAY